MISVTPYGRDGTALARFLVAEREGLNRTESGVYGLLHQLVNKDVLFVAWDGDEVIGIVALTPGEKRSDRHTASLRIHVREGYRGTGVGRQLMEKALEYADSRGLTRLVATPYIHSFSWAKETPSVDSRRKMQFFERHGFAVEGVMKQAAKLLDGSLTDAALMARVRS